jgi:hypothetical protein
MTMSFSNFLELELLDHVFLTGSYSQPSNIYIALTKSTIDDTHTGSTLPSEVSGGAYARKSCGTWDTASAGSTKNGVAITFVQATAQWGTVTDFGIVDASAAGNLLAYAKLTTAKSIATGDTAKFATGDLKISLN